jgi:chaperonin GroEL
MISKNILLKSDALKKILEGINKTADAVKVTLGPGGMTAIIGKYSSPDITKDGVKVAKSITLDDPEENIGCQLTKTVASDTVDAAGDGTTTATVLFQSLTNKAMTCYLAGMSATDIKNGIKYGVNKTISFLKSKSQMISGDHKEIEQVATISANGDTKVGKAIAEMMSKIGFDGIINVEDGKSTETTHEYVEGMRFDQGFKSVHFANNQQRQVCEMEDVNILICDKKLDSAQQVQKIVEIIEMIKGEPLLIIAEDIDGPVLTVLAINSLRQTIKVCAVKAPGFGESRKEMSEDIATFTGGMYISESLGRSLEKFDDINYLGKAKKVIVDSKSTTIISGAGNPKEIKSRCDMLKGQIESEDSDYAKENLQKRLAKLQGKACNYKVGGATEAEQKELKDRVEDAIQAVRAAVEEGILPGGGSSYVRASRELTRDINHIRKNGHIIHHSHPEESGREGSHKKIHCSHDFIAGIEVVAHSLLEPIKQSLLNAGLQDEWQTIIKTIKDNDHPSYGYDIPNQTFCDMISVGIIDAAKCLTSAISNAGHTAALLIGSGSLITDKPEPKEKDNGGMGGMGGMY